MRILKTGKIKPEYTRIKKCRYCKTVFEYERKDIVELTIDGTDLFDGVQCPICEGYLAVSIFDKKGRRLSKYETL